MGENNSTTMVYAMLTGEAAPVSGAAPTGRCWELGKDYSSLAAAKAGVKQIEPQIVKGGLARFGVNVTFNEYGLPTYYSSPADCHKLSAFAGAPVDVHFADFPGSSPATGITAFKT